MVSIYGNEVPKVKADEDIKAIAINIIVDLTGVVVRDHMVKDCHRMSDKILVSFVYAGTCSSIVKILASHRSNQHRHRTWINIHQSPLDRKLSFLARQMKREGILDFAGTTLAALTRVGKGGQKFTIYSEEDLQKLSDKPLSSFLKSKDPNDSGISMEY